MYFARILTDPAALLQCGTRFHQNILDHNNTIDTIHIYIYVHLQSSATFI